MKLSYRVDVLGTYAIGLFYYHNIFLVYLLTIVPCAKGFDRLPGERIHLAVTAVEG